MKKRSRFILSFTLALSLASIIGCGQSAGISLPANFYSNVTVSWSPNHENAVNTTGGGYRVYFSTTAGFSTNTARYVNVPYSAATSSVPTTATLTHLPPGKYHIKIVAYSALNQPGSTTGGVSPSSNEVIVSVP